MTSKPAAQLPRYALVALIILIILVIPAFRRALVRSKEFTLKNQLYTLRVTIDEYTFDKKRAPQKLEDLVQSGYLREVPIDPMTASNQSWRATIRASNWSNVPGIFDIRSGSGAIGLDGAPYSEW
jgi:general secretion pathway protein G